MKAIVGVDIGSSAVKAALVPIAETSLDGNKIEVFKEELRSRISGISAGHFEEDPRTIHKQVFELIRAISSRAKQKNYAIEAIAFTGQMHGGLLVDRDLEPLTHFITWQDKRGDETVGGESYVERIRKIAPIDPTGVSIHTGFLISTLFWLQQMKRIPTHAAYVLGIYDWLTSLLVGRAVTDISSAAAWAMFDPIDKKWKKDLIESLGISQSLFPEIAEPGAFLGTIEEPVASKLGLPRGVRVHASIGDTQAAYLGSECMGNEILLNFGTGSQSLWETDRPIATSGTDIRYLHHDRYLACAPTLAGGEAYNIVANFFQDIVRNFSQKEIPMEAILPIMDRLALESDSNGLAVDPIFRGSKFREDAERGSINHITSENFVTSSFVRALVEGMVEEVATPYFERNELGHTGLVGAGSALVRNLALIQIAEKRFNMPLRLARFDEAAAMGAAMLCVLPKS